MRLRTWLSVSVLLVVAALPGCGGTIYAVVASSAAGKVEKAKHLGAEKLAPYEFTFASEHLTKASSEAAQGDYSDAIDFAEIAEEYADRAINLTREAHRGAGR